MTCVRVMVGGSSQIWDLASGKLKLSLTGHISTVRGVAVSSRSPYLFSCGEDKQVKCWDLEYNKVQCPAQSAVVKTYSPILCYVHLYIFVQWYLLKEI